MKRGLLILWILTLLGLCSHNATALTEYEEGLKLYKEARFEEAKAKFEAYLATHPNDPNTLYYLGKLETDGIKSQEYYRKLWIEHPGHPLADDALYAIAEYNYAKGYYSTARGMFRNLLILYPESEFAQKSQYWLGVVYLVMDKPDSARVEFRSYQRKYPNSELFPWATLGIADSYFQEKRFNQALKEYQWLLRSRSGKEVKSTVLYRLGQCYRSLGKEREAKKYFNRVLEGSPRSCEAALLRKELEEKVAKKAEEEAVPQEKSTTEGPGRQPEPAQKPQYTIQVGAFTSRENAHKLCQRLLAKGYPAEISSKKVDQIRFHLVWVGRFTDKGQAEILAHKLAVTQGLQYRIVTLKGEE